MDSSVSPKDSIWFLRVCHHISTGLYLVCPGLLRAVGETSYVIWVWLIELHIVFIVCLFVYLYLRCKVSAYPVKQTKIILKKKPQPSLLSRTSNLFVFDDHTIHTTSLTQLSYSTVTTSHPIPLSAANRFSRLKLSVCNPYYLSPTVSEYTLTV